MISPDLRDASPVPPEAVGGVVVVEVDPVLRGHGRAQHHEVGQGEVATSVVL